MERRKLLLAAGAATLILTSSAGAADIRLGDWLYEFNTDAELSVSVPLTNNSTTDSGPIVLRLWATQDPRSSTSVSADAFVLVETVLQEGVPALDSVEVNSEFMAIIEEPAAGQYNIALTVEEQAIDAEETITSFASARIDFPLPEVPSAAEVRRRVASQIPCGALFVQFSLATFLGLCALRRGGLRPAQG